MGCSYYEDVEKVGIVYFIGTDNRKKGYASEATSAYVKYFLEHYKVPEMIATIKTQNKASCKVVENCGFDLLATKMYKDIYDEKEEDYNFYQRKIL